MTTGIHRLSAALVAAAAFAVLPIAPAVAAPESSLEARTSAIIAANPGGVELAPGIIAWERGAVVLTLDGAVSPQSVGTCLTGQYCAWSGTGYTGTKLTFTACSSGGTSSSVALLSGLVRSSANARTSGTVKAVAGSSVIYSMAAGTGNSANGTTLTALVCYS